MIKQNHNVKEKRTEIFRFFFTGCGSYLFSRAVTRKVSSAQVSLTSVFGMRTGGSSPPLPPQWYIHRVLRFLVLSFSLAALGPVKYLSCQSLQTDNRIINYFSSVFVLLAFANFFFLARLISYNLVSVSIRSSLNFLEIKPSTY